MPHHIENVLNALTHQKTDSLPRGELFFGDDYLDRHFPRLIGNHALQLQRATELLDLSAIGVDMNPETSRSALSDGAYDGLGEYFVIGFINGPFSRLIESEGFVAAMVSTRKNPALLDGVSERFLRQVERLAKEAAAKGFRALALADDIAGKNGLIFSPAYFSSALLPHYRAFSDIVRANGLSVFLHSDGDMRRVINQIIEAGFDCIHPVDVQGGLNLEELRADFGHRVSFMGHVDLMAWDSQRVAEEVAVAEKAFTAGGLILGSSGGIVADIEEGVLSALHNVKRGEPDR